MRIVLILATLVGLEDAYLPQANQKTAAPIVREIPPGPARTGAGNPREIAASALKAASAKALPKWVAPWQQRLRTAPNDRSAMFAVAVAHRLSYDYKRADSLYARVAAGHRDALAHQSELALAVTRANAGQLAQANAELRALELKALGAGDTLTALDVILARSGTVLRMEGANAALAVLAIGDSLNWRRDPAQDALSRCRLSGIHSRLGNRERARALAREGFAIATRAQLDRLAASCQFTLVTEFARTGLTDSLRAPLSATIATQERTGDLAGLGVTRQWAGFYLLSLGKTNEAQYQLSNAWNASERAGTMNVSAWIALNLAAVGATFYDAASNSLWLDRADALMRKVGDQQGLVEVSRALAGRAQRAGNDVAADQYLQTAHAMAERLAEPGSQMSVAASLFELAMDRGRLDDASKWLDLRRSLVDRYKMSGWTFSQNTDDAEISLRRGEAEKALGLLNDGLKALHPSQRKFKHQMESQRALALALLGDPRGAASAALAAAESFDRWRASLTDRSLQSLTVQAQRDQGWYTSSLIANLSAAGELDAAFSLTERRRARDLRDRLAIAAASRADTTAPDSSSQSPMSVAELQRALPDNKTALVMLDAGEGGVRGTAFVLTKQSLSAHPLPSVNDIAPRVRRLVALLESGRDAIVESRALGNSLIAPLLPRLDSASVTRLVFLPEGVLHRLPFDVLRLPDGRFLIERFETAVAPSATVLARLIALPVRAIGAPRILAFADAEATRSRSSEPTPDSPLFTTLFGSATLLPRLGGARTEVSAVKRIFPGTSVRAGVNATEDVVKRSASGYDVLHFATHAVVDEWSGASAALALTAGGGDDGMFDSNEIARLRLPASLVVLSACRTVGGEVIAGEGVRGLTTAFLQAGAQSVIATAWRVNDRQVVPVITSLYEQLAKNQPVGAALRSAQLTAIRRNVSPSAWAAFTLVGDPWRVVANGGR